MVRSAAVALDNLLGTLELDEAGEMNAAIAYALARRLDDAVEDTKGDVAIAISAIAKELRAVVDALVATADTDVNEFVASLFSEVGDPAHA